MKELIPELRALQVFTDNQLLHTSQVWPMMRFNNSLHQAHQDSSMLRIEEQQCRQIPDKEINKEMRGGNH